jgi:hypothetical protein
MTRTASRTWLFPVAALLVAAAVFKFAGGSATQTPEKPSASAVPPEPSVPDPPAKAAADTPADAVQKMQGLDDAVRYTRPMMSDEVDKTSLGAALLAVWAQTHLKLSDVNVSKDETSFALVRQSPGAERGKRLCTKGTIMEMEAEQTRWGITNHGALSDGKNPVYFIAVGSTGTLSRGSSARFCGIAAGKYDSTSNSGLAHAIQVVGMFDLPENR